jgi:hypothetical protein
MTKKDASEIPPADPPPGFGPVAAAAEQERPARSSLEETMPGIERPLEQSAPVPVRRRKQKDREAGPSEKQVYVPPVSLPPNREEQIVDAPKIRVAPSVMVVSDERSRPTMRRLPSHVLPPPQADPNAQSRTVGGRTARMQAVTGVLPPEEEPRTAQVINLPTRTQRIKAVTGAAAARPDEQGGKEAGSSPWAKDGEEHIDKADLPSAQLHSSTAREAPLVTFKPASRSRSNMSNFAALIVVASIAAGSAFVLLRDRSKKPVDTTPIEVVATAPAPATPPATQLLPPPAPPEPEPAQTAPVSLPQPLESRPAPATTRKSRPPPPAPAAPKPTATTQPAATAPPPAATTSEPPRPPDGAPPRPF